MKYNKPVNGFVTQSSKVVYIWSPHTDASKHARTSTHAQSTYLITVTGTATNMKNDNN